MEKSSLSTLLVLFAVFLVVILGFVFIQPIRALIRSTTGYWYVADKVATPLMRTLDPEKAHQMTVSIVKNEFAPPG